jgi:hypothetical protein
MSDRNLERVVEEIPSLRAVFITAMPDCLLYDSWLKADETWTSEEVASYFGDLIRANREGLKALRAWSSEMQVTIESTDVLLVLREVSADFVVSFAFARNAPLGMVRLHVKRALALLDELLPKIRPEERPRALRISEFLTRYAPDAHTALKRAALRSGVPVELLERPEHLSVQQVEQFERSVCAILGLDTLSL